MLRNPLTLEFLLHCHISPSPHKSVHILAWADARDYLLDKGMITVRKEGVAVKDNIYTTTDRGKFFIDHLIGIPFPVEHNTFVITETQVK